MLASYYNNLEAVEVLLKSKVNINEKNNYGRTALLKACEKENLRIIKLLLEAGANVNDRDDEKFTALIIASKFDCKELIKLLLEKGANINDININGYTSLIMATSFNKLEIVNILLEHSSDINHKDNNGWTSLMLASEKGYIDIAKLLIEKGASLEEKNNNGWTALMLASYYNHKELVNLLIEKGSNLDDKNNNGWTPIMIASQKGFKEIVFFLLNKGVNVDTKLYDDIIALTLACQSKNIEIARMLIEKSLNILIDVKNLKILAQLIFNEIKNKESKKQKEFLYKLLFENDKLSLKFLLFIYKGISLFDKNAEYEIVINTILEDVNIASIFFYDSFTFYSKCLLIDCFFLSIEMFEIDKLNEVKRIKKLIIKTFLEYQEGKEKNDLEYKEKFKDDNKILKIKLHIFIDKLIKVIINFKNDFTNQELLEELEK